MENSTTFDYKKIPKYLLLLCVFIMAPFSIFAQTVSPSEQVSISITPEIPGAYEAATARVVSYIVDTDRSEIIWFEDGIEVTRSIGGTTYDFTTKGIDQETTIQAVLLTPKGEDISVSIKITPFEVDLLWEADTHTPPFYRGKALPTYKSTIRVAAIPASGLDNAKEYLYEWKDRRFYSVQDASGFGRDTFTVEGEIPPTGKMVEVIVSSLDGSQKARKRISVETVDPKLVMYRYSPLTGVNYEHALSNRGVERIETPELYLHVEPYYFSNIDFSSKTLTYKWDLNNDEILRTNRGGQKLVFSTPDTAGRSTLEVFIENAAKLIQRASVSLNLIY